jgi:hypothetical protein
MAAAAPTHYRRMRAGPEATLQASVVNRLHDLFPQQGRLVWTAGSPQIGAGCPDIVLTAYEPHVVALTDVHLSEHALLAYLHAVRRARAETISARLQRSPRALERSLSALVESKIIIVDHGAYALSDDWRSILPEVVAIEVKVGDWRRAASQAIRNSIFAHRSFVALPKHVAARARSEELFREYGIGILAVEDGGEVHVAKRARRGMPRVWSYYYSLASMTARHLTGKNRGVRRSDRKCEGSVS